MVRKPDTFEDSFESIPKSKFWSKKNGNITPRYIFRNSGKKFWFDCDVCYHTFQICISNITTLGQWCPYCCKNSRTLCDNEDCKQCFEKSFASCEKAKFWSSKNIITSRQVIKNSTKKFLFDCNECGHEIEMQLSKITSRNHWCSYCAKQRLCNNEDCEFCYQNSFASHERAKYWSNKNELSSRAVFKGTAKKFWFDCPVCDHTFLADLHHMTSPLKRWCSYCTNKNLCNDPNCKICFEKSFASHFRSKYWSNKNDVKPRDVFKSANRNFLFKCEVGHEFSMDLGNVTVCNHWCPKCTRKTERKLYDWLDKHYNVTKEFKAEWCRNPETNRYLPFDFLLDDHNIIIELDGEQHFREVQNWGEPEDIQNRDFYKQYNANTNEYPIIRIYQMDVYNDNYNWKKEIKKHINKCINSDSIHNHYICNNHEYKSWRMGWKEWKRLNENEDNG